MRHPRLRAGVATSAASLPWCQSASGRTRISEPLPSAFSSLDPPQRRNACTQLRQRAPGLYADVEDAPIYGEIALVVPAHESPPKIFGV